MIDESDEPEEEVKKPVVLESRDTSPKSIGTLKTIEISASELNPPRQNLNKTTTLFPVI